MKKFLFLAIAAAAMTSCSQDEVLEVAQKQAISFGSAFVGNATRAASATDPSYYTDGETEHTQLTTFNVYGTVNDVNIFDGVAITKGTAAYGAVWAQEEGTKTQYWVPGASYLFDAVVDATEVVTNQTTGLPETLKYTTSTQTDMLHNRQEVASAAADQGVVAFEFTHLLSKVKFSIVNSTVEDATNYQYVITNATLTNVYTNGDYAVPAGTWSEQVVGTYALDSKFEVSSAETEVNAREVLLIPGSAVGISFTVELQTKDAEGNWATVSSDNKEYPAVATLEANSAYHFILNVGIGSPIQFTATEMDEWDTVDDITVDTITDPAVDEEGEGTDA